MAVRRHPSQPWRGEKWNLLWSQEMSCAYTRK
jgi:hypothetical protein